MITYWVSFERTPVPVGLPINSSLQFIFRLEKYENCRKGLTLALYMTAIKFTHSHTCMIGRFDLWGWSFEVLHQLLAIDLLPVGLVDVGCACSLSPVTILSYPGLSIIIYCSKKYFQSVNPSIIDTFFECEINVEKVCREIVSCDKEKQVMYFQVKKIVALSMTCFTTVNGLHDSIYMFF